jgi:hypothetical protein
VALSLAVVFGAGPATALDDVTGVYSGTIACESTDGSGESRTPSEATSLYVDDAGSDTAYAYLNNSGYTFRLAVVAGPGAAQGRMAGPGCTMTSVAGGPLLQLEIKAKPGSDKASLRGEFIALNVGANAHYVTVCRLSLRRTLTTLPGPIACP